MPLYNPTPSFDYVQSRGSQLITNSTGSTLDNTNFTTLTYDVSDVPQVGVFGAFRSDDMAVDRTCDEYIPIDPYKYYRMSMYIKGDNASGTAYAGFASYDMDYQLVLTSNTYHALASETTLTVALTSGATTMTVADASGWVASGSDNAIVGFWPYMSSGGYTFPDYYYTRNTWRYGPTTMAGTPKSGNVITCASGYAYSGPTMPVGTKVAQMFAGYQYNYNCILNQGIPNTYWGYVVGNMAGFGGAGSGSTDAGNMNLFRPGTTAIRPYFRLNASSISGARMWVAGVTMDGDYRGFWTGVTYANSWVTYAALGASVAYRQEYAGVVRLRGHMSGGTTGTGSTGTAFTLPVGMRPTRACEFAVSTGATTKSVGYINVGIDGTVKVTSGDNTRVSVDGITIPIN